MDNPLRIYSDGAGTQSIAVMVLQARGLLPNPYDAFIFANVGNDSENPATIDYRQKYVIPFAEKYGLVLIERQKLYKGKPQTLLTALNDSNRTIAIPVYFGSGGKGNRKCTQDWKVEVVNRYLKMEHKPKPTHVEMGIGFSSEEGGRIWQKYPGWHDYNMNRDKKTRQWVKGKKIGFNRKFEYPLVDLQMTKADCIKLVVDEFGEQPPGSLCWFCPFTKVQEHNRRRAAGSPLFDASVALENRLNEKYAELNRTTVNPSNAIYLTALHVPLAEIPEQLTLWDEYLETDGQCDTGTCGF